MDFIQVGQKVIEKYNCALPWMHPLDYPDTIKCEVDTIPRNGTEDHHYDYATIWDMVYDWEKFYKYAQEYEDLLPCNRTVFDSVIEMQPKEVKNDLASVTIQYVNPYIQVIKDSSSYDMQSLIGEVGGTLGLLLGFSFISIFDLFESVLKSCLKRN